MPHEEASRTCGARLKNMKKRRPAPAKNYSHPFYRQHAKRRFHLGRGRRIGYRPAKPYSRRSSGRHRRLDVHRFGAWPRRLGRRPARCRWDGWRWRRTRPHEWGAHLRTPRRFMDIGQRRNRLADYSAVDPPAAGVGLVPCRHCCLAAKAAVAPHSESGVPTQEYPAIAPA